MNAVSRSQNIVLYYTYLCSDNIRQWVTVIAESETADKRRVLYICIFRICIHMHMYILHHSSLLGIIVAKPFLFQYLVSVKEKIKESEQYIYLELFTFILVQSAPSFSSVPKKACFSWGYSVFQLTIRLSSSS